MNTLSVFLNLFSKLLSIFAFTPTLFGARYSSALITKNSDSFSFKEDNDRALLQNSFLQGINEYIWSLSSQSQCVFTAIHCLPYAKYAMSLLSVFLMLECIVTYVFVRTDNSITNSIDNSVYNSASIDCNRPTKSKLHTINGI